MQRSSGSTLSLSSLHRPEAVENSGFLVKKVKERKQKVEGTVGVVSVPDTLPQEEKPTVTTVIDSSTVVIEASLRPALRPR